MCRWQWHVQRGLELWGIEPGVSRACIGQHGSSAVRHVQCAYERLLREAADKVGSVRLLLFRVVVNAFKLLHYELIVVGCILEMCSKLLIDVSFELV